MSVFKQYSIALLMLLTIFFAIFLFISQSRLTEEQKNFDSFERQSKTLVSLKEKWKSNKKYKNIFARLRAISKPKNETLKTLKGKRYILDFANVSQINLEQIMKILFNSNFNIKELNVKREYNKISLHVEVQL